jgi:phosphatidate phosphatase PAH1
VNIPKATAIARQRVLLHQGMARLFVEAETKGWPWWYIEARLVAMATTTATNIRAIEATPAKTTEGAIYLQIKPEE